MSDRLRHTPDDAQNFKQDADHETESRPSVTELIMWGEKGLRGELQGNTDEYAEATPTGKTLGETGEFSLQNDSGMIADLNDQRYTPLEHNVLLRWMEQRLGSPIAATPSREQYQFADGSVSFRILDKAFGTPDDQWYFSEWQNENGDEGADQPWYVLWSEMMYAAQEENGFEKVEDTKE